MARAWRGEAGQGSVEWIGIVALVAAMLGLGAALAQAGFLGRHVTREITRAYCVVSHGDCRRDQEPCVVAAGSDGSGWSASVAILRFGHDRLALVEQRSDGTYAVTLEGAWKGGVGAAGGRWAKLKFKGIDFTAGAEVTASVLMRLAGGRTWVVGSEAAARSLIAAGGAARAPDVTYGDGAWLDALGATIGTDAFGAGSVTAAEGEATHERHWGTSTDHRTGHRTTSIHQSWSAQGSLLGDLLGASAGREGDVIAIEADATGRPLDLRITSAGRYAGSQDLPGVVQPVAGLLATADAEDRRYEVTAHLDLTDARNLAAARAILGALAHHDALATPTAALRRIVAQRATIEARVVADRATTGGDGASVNVHGLTVGLDRATERHDRRLLAATSRGLDGQWITRTDCA
jgi:hypothetical protein